MMKYEFQNPLTSFSQMHPQNLPAPFGFLLAGVFIKYIIFPQDSYNLIVPPAPPLKVSSKLLPRKTFIIGKYLASALSLLLSAATCVPWDSVEQKYLATTVCTVYAILN